MRIVFMGTPEFAVPSLEILHRHGYDIAAVITAPDKPAGRGNKIHQSAVKEYALAHQLPLLQPTHLKSEAFLEELRALKAALQIVVAFRMLPEVVWQMPPLGTFNLHASLLPRYRGAAPINWAIVQGEKETGVSTFFLQHEIDTGHIIFQEKEPILPHDDAGSLYERLKIKGADLVLKTVQAIEQGEVPRQPQEGVVTHAPKIFKEHCQINWQQSPQEIDCFVRGVSPAPAAWTVLQGKHCKIFRVQLDAVLPSPPAPLAVGDFYTDGKHFLAFQTGQGLLAVQELQLEGKKRMFVEEFLRGFRI